MVIEEENGRAHRPRRSIDYLPTARPYREAVADDVSDDDESTAQGGVENGSSRAGHEL
jgi:hypothetical protein